ncbi:hypothetical protein F52700_11811 [Fusarium sp. NRRL 52700]|nr:hypothetical protein F52700_11811 [Fusarium sp. NRRL 52700]
MTDNNNNKKKKPGEETMSDQTREGLRRMTVGLTDQTTIKTLSRAGMMAKNKREQLHFHRGKTIARIEGAEKKEGEAEEDKEQNKKQT